MAPQYQSERSKFLTARGWRYHGGGKWRKGSDLLLGQDAQDLEERIEDEIEASRHSVVPEELEEELLGKDHQRPMNRAIDREYWIRMGA